MHIKRTIWIPIVGGLVFAVLSFLFSAANFTIKISDDLILGPWEILSTLSAALFGPIGLLISELGLDGGGYLYIFKGVFPAPQDLYFMLGDYIAHVVALLATAFCYRYIYERVKMPLLLLGWVLTLGIFYTTLWFIQVPLFNIAVPGLGATFVGYLTDFIPEAITTTVVTSLILLGLPQRYRRPQWYEPKQIPDQGGEIQDEWKAGP